MPKIDELTRQERLERIQRLLLRHPLGLRESEIAQRMGLPRRTVNDYLWSAELATKVYKDGVVWFADPVAASITLRPVHLTPEQAVTLYLAARLLVKQHDKRNESAETALLKLADALRSDTDVGREVYQAAEELASRPTDTTYSQIFGTVVQGFVYRRVVHLVYRPLHGRPFECHFSPYLLEPSAVGHTTYAIGHSDPPGALRTRKLERILEAELTRQTFEVPPDFPGLEILRTAWSVIFGDELVEVRLRFSPRAAERVRETRWHPSQQIEATEDGGCIWTAQVADLTDILPWVRGWGADVEALAPQSLREAMAEEAQRLAAVYGIQPIPTYQWLWAKTSRDPTLTHPLVCHMIDVAQVAQALWNTVLTDDIRTRFTTALGLDVEKTGRLLAFWVGLHDLGKASPAFQSQCPSVQANLVNAGLTFPKSYVREPCYHGTISAYALGPLLEAETRLARDLARQIARAVGGHHGAWPSPHEMQHLRSTQIGGDDWDAVRRELVQIMVRVFAPPTLAYLPTNNQEENSLLTLLSGLTAVADWIGSMEHYFPYTSPPIDPRRYAHQAAERAVEALDKLGWTGWQPPTEGISFRALFKFEPRLLQEAVVTLADKLDRPALVIIEAPTGIGKTEAALYLADWWACARQQRGLYVAMPTMATSNQMFRRVREVLARRYPQHLVNLQLVHSQAQWREDMQSCYLETADEREGGSVVAMTWFLPRKRSLLAPFGVGTVDQALLSVLQTRHFFVRLFGLAHKTIIFDEVHAYDTYMSAIFQRLLGWLRAVGTSVVLLSATLPAQTRRELLRAYLGSPDLSVPDIPYPAITWAMDDRIEVVPLEASASRTVTLEWIGSESDAITHCLAEALREGGCAAVICNTVKRAQELYQAIQEARIVAERDLILFHARFPFAWRDQIEQKVLARFGKGNDRPHQAIVVATQVVEQSLDLDFDLMISEPAPVDLILQRAGRLHRHERDYRPRPLTTPRLLLTTPADTDGVPDFKQDVHVYEPYVLLRSYLVLRDRTYIALPADTSALIEAVYGDGDLAVDLLTPKLAAALEGARQKMEQAEQTHVFWARQKLIPKPDADNLLVQSNLCLEEDSPELHEAFQALTRLGRPGVSLVCLHQTPVGLRLEPDGEGPVVDLTQKPGPDLTRALAQYIVTVTHPSVIRHFLDQPLPTAWRDHPLLRNHRPAIFTDGVCPLAGTPYTLRLSRDRGLEIEKEGE